MVQNTVIILDICNDVNTVQLNALVTIITSAVKSLHNNSHNTSKWLRVFSFNARMFKLASNGRSAMFVNRLFNETYDQVNLSQQFSIFNTSKLTIHSKIVAREAISVGCS